MIRETKVIIRDTADKINQELASINANDPDAPFTACSLRSSKNGIMCIVERHIAPDRDTAINTLNELIDEAPDDITDRLEWLRDYVRKNTQTHP